jgi:hypothetical protein
LAAAVSLRDARDDHAARLVAQRVYVRSRKQLWWDRVTAGLCVAVIGVVLASDYHDGAWHNPEGAVVAVSPTEDGILHYVGECK